ncbi:WW domain-containing oxidoreductase [Galendromus occidentalis]|uniref:WW domain-containing oxidoreductase n=1 Tax=Galendromus occidentalis TaxID=34638 RepID=A0AAJ6QUQ9_9ACAR|nr:WW domain-containing oxidoreductase [Galendromus occidentalis]
MANDSDSDDELPPGWREQANKDGSVAFINACTGEATFEHPVTRKRKCVPKELPFGWVEQFDGGKVFVNCQTGQRTTVDPRLAFKTEDTDTFRRRFDSHATCWDVLEGINLSNKTVLVTGGSAGIGWLTALSLAAHGSRVVFTTRNFAQSEDAIKQALSDRPNLKLEAMFVDFLDLSSVRSFAFEFRKKYDTLNILILNAGIFGPGFELSRDGFESTLQVNHLSQFYLYKQLQSLLVSSSPSRVIVLSSESHRQSFLTTPEDISEERLTMKSPGRFWFSLVAYNDSKLFNILFARELDRRMSKQGIRALAVHPGNMIRTSISRTWWFWKLLFFLASPFTKSIEQGAATTVYAAASPDMEDRGALYLNNCCICSATKAANDDKLAEKLWRVSEKILKDLNMQ